jgi:hypothetical protein
MVSRWVLSLSAPVPTGGRVCARSPLLGRRCRNEGRDRTSITCLRLLSSETSRLDRDRCETEQSVRRGGRPQGKWTVGQRSSVLFVRRWSDAARRGMHAPVGRPRRTRRSWPLPALWSGSSHRASVPSSVPRRRFGRELSQHRPTPPMSPSIKGLTRLRIAFQHTSQAGERYGDGRSGRSGDGASKFCTLDFIKEGLGKAGWVGARRGPVSRQHHHLRGKTSTRE